MKIGIATVNYFNDELLAYNIEHIASNNSNIDFYAYITNNSKFEYKSRLDNLSITNLSEIDRTTCLMQVKHGFRAQCKNKIKPGLHHGAALDKAINELYNRDDIKYIILMDSDYFNLLNIDIYIEYMKEKKDVCGLHFHCTKDSELLKKNINSILESVKNTPHPQNNFLIPQGIAKPCCK